MAQARIDYTILKPGVGSGRSVVESVRKRLSCARVYVLLAFPVAGPRVGGWRSLEASLAYWYSCDHPPAFEVTVLLSSFTPVSHVLSLESGNSGCTIGFTVPGLPVITVEEEVEDTYGEIGVMKAAVPEIRVTAKDVFDNVALGGTFDRLHAGHKIMLSIASYISNGSVLIGVTVDELLSRKEYRELIQPYEERAKQVDRFVRIFRPGLKYKVIPLHRPEGPLNDDPNAQSLVVSTETLAGAKRINEQRRSRGLNELDVFVISLVNEGGARDGRKWSSTESRKREFELKNQPSLDGETSGRTDV